MKINDKIVNTYLAGKPIDVFKDEWYFTNSQVAGQIGKNIFTPPAYTDEQKAKVREIHTILLQTVQSFEPINISVWNELFPDWKAVFVNVNVDLILGFPEPHDATVESDGSGERHIIFDLACWTKYLGYDIATITRNLLTHELCHILIGKHIPHIDEDMENPDYLTALDALTFHEAFAHLVSYDAMEIDEVDWSAPELQKVREKSCKTMHKALASTDEKEQEHYLYTAQCGNYYDKYACMAGMLYLAEQWQMGGVQALKTCFIWGYHGFAKKCGETACQ